MHGMFCLFIEQIPSGVLECDDGSSKSENDCKGKKDEKNIYNHEEEEGSSEKRYGVNECVRNTQCKNDREDSKSRNSNEKKKDDGKFDGCKPVLCKHLPGIR